jgi:hypothetical protein
MDYSQGDDDLVLNQRPVYFCFFERKPKNVKAHRQQEKSYDRQRNDMRKQRRQTVSS